MSGGGVWCESASAVVSNCVLTGNSAYCDGGGAYCGTLNNCTLTGNSARSRRRGILRHAQQLHADGQFGFASGGGAYYGTLNNCTLTGNSACSLMAAGHTHGTLNNCIVYYNTARSDGELLRTAR